METIKILNEPKAKAKAKPKAKPKAKAKPNSQSKINKEILNITKDKQIIAHIKKHQEKQTEQHKTISQKSRMSKDKTIHFLFFYRVSKSIGGALGGGKGGNVNV